MVRWSVFLVGLFLCSTLLEDASADPSVTADPVAQAIEPDDDEKGMIERAVELADIPAAAREVILEEAGDHELQELEEVIVGGKTYYEAEWLSEGMEVEIIVTPEGEIVGREVEAPDDDDDDDDEDRDSDDK